MAEFEDSIREEFSAQTEVFARGQALAGEAILGAILETIPADAEARWLELACGAGMVGRALARRVGFVRGVDLTPAMVARAREEAGREGLDNVEFGVGDATALDLPEASFDGALTRFSLHHVPAPQRVLEQMARVVRPGGLVVVSDHARDDDPAVAAWVEEIERLRDPTHWACLTPARLRVLGEGAGLELECEQVLPFELAFEEWRERGSGGSAAADLIDRLLTEAPAGAGAFSVRGSGAERVLSLRNMVFRWRRP